MNNKLSLPESVETERLLLRKLRYEDAEEIFFTYASKPEATKFMMWPTHQNIEDTRNFLLYAIEGWRSGTDYSYSIRIRNSGRLAGSWGLLNDDGKIQFGYILGPTYWGNGFATEACLAMMAVLKKTTGIHRIGSFVDTENVASSRVLLKTGLVEEALLSRWHRFVNQDNLAKDCILFKLPLQA